MQCKSITYPVTADSGPFTEPIAFPHPDHTFKLKLPPTPPNESVQTQGHPRVPPGFPRNHDTTETISLVQVPLSCQNGSSARLYKYVYKYLAHRHNSEWLQKYIPHFSISKLRIALKNAQVNSNMNAQPALKLAPIRSLLQHRPNAPVDATCISHEAGPRHQPQRPDPWKQHA